MSLAFANITFHNNVDKMEPAEFHPDVKEYTIYPTLGSDSIIFSVTMNQIPQPGDTSDFYYRAFPNYDLYYKKNWDIYRYKWLPSDPANPQEHKNYIAVEDRGSIVELRCEAQSNDVETFFITLLVKTPIGQCPHDNTYSVDGDVFGGASGSCQIETLIYCNNCGKLVDKQCEYHN